MAESEGEGAGWDDDLWGDEAAPSDPRAVRAIQIGLALVIVAIVGATFLLRGRDGDDATNSAGTTSSTTAVTGSVPGAPLTGGTASPRTGWPDDVNLRPAALGRLGGSPDEVGDPPEPGVYVWSDFDGWHLWVVNGDGVGPVSGVITGSDQIGSAVAVPEGAGTATVTDHQITFDLDDSPAVTGLDFNPGFYATALVFDLQGPDGPLPAGVVHLGRDRAPASAMPLVVEQGSGP